MALISQGGGSKKTTTSTKKTTTTTKKTTPTTTKKTTTSTPKTTTVSKPTNTSSAYNQATYTPPKTTTTTKTNTSKNTSSAYNQATYTPPKTTTTTTPKQNTSTYKPQTSPSYTPPKVTVPKIEVKPTPQVPSTANNSAVNNSNSVKGVAGSGILTPPKTPLPTNSGGSTTHATSTGNTAGGSGGTFGSNIPQHPGSFNGFTPITNFTTDANGNPNTPDQRVISNAINNTPSTAKKGNATIDEVYQAQNYYNDVIKPSLQSNNNNNNNNNSERLNDYYYGGSTEVNAEQSLVESQSFYDDLMAAFLEMNEAARQDAIDAILKNLDAVKGTYKDQIQQTIDEYAKLVNQNEVAKDRARRVVKENQANRGQLDSGMGRQERLNLDIGYDNKTADLNAARQQAVNEIYNLIAQAEAEAASNKASINNQYDNAILQWQIANS